MIGQETSLPELQLITKSLTFLTSGNCLTRLVILPLVVAASDKPDLGLEELSSLNVKSRFQVFEKSESTENDVERSPSTVNVKRSPSILSKLAK